MPLNLADRAGVSVNGKLSYTLDQAAAQLDRAGLSWSSALGQGATVTYAYRATAPSTLPTGVTGFSPLTSAQITGAELALTAWADVANIHFVRVGSGTSGAGAYSNNATILFSDYSSGQDGAAAFTYLPGSTRASAMEGDVWIASTDPDNRSAVNGSYGLETLTHEIGHAIGLSHPSDYNADDSDSDITYAANASYYEDSREYSVMSYFASSNTGGSASVFAVAPQLDDIAAAQRLYGANMTTRTGDDVYGFHSNLASDGGDRPWYELTSSSDHFYAAIWDAGGNDTLDFSGYSANQLIDLQQGDFSNVGGDIGNLAIAVGTQIENAIGGSGADILIGNELNNVLTGGGGRDVLTGGGGADIFRDTELGLAGDTITDFTRGDQIDFTDSPLSFFNFLKVGHIVYYSGVSLTLSSNFLGRLIVNGDGNGGTTLSLTDHDPALGDLNGDGHSDLLWRNSDTGVFSEWTVAGNVTADQLTSNTYFNGQVGTDWTLEGTLDFNADGMSDLLWRNPSTGAFSIWDATGTGFTPNSYVDGGVPPSWALGAVGDFNGDGTDDLLWRDTTSGVFSIWEAVGGGFARNAIVDGSQATTNHIVAVGDFNGDGLSDLLWRTNAGVISEWLSTGSGFTQSVYVNATVDLTWHVAAAADFNGDGKSDILWRSDTGVFTIWQSTGSGFVANTYVDGSVRPDWTIAQVGDFNDDGKADLLWRHSDGVFSVWQGSDHGFLQNVLVNGSVGPTWTPVTTHYDFV